MKLWYSAKIEKWQNGWMIRPLFSLAVRATDGNTKTEYNTGRGHSLLRHFHKLALWPTVGNTMTGHRAGRGHSLLQPFINLYNDKLIASMTRRHRKYIYTYIVDFNVRDGSGYIYFIETGRGQSPLSHAN